MLDLRRSWSWACWTELEFDVHSASELEFLNQIGFIWSSNRFHCLSFKSNLGLEVESASELEFLIKIRRASLLWWLNFWTNLAFSIESAFTAGASDSAWN